MGELLDSESTKRELAIVYPATIANLYKAIQLAITQLSSYIKGITDNITHVDIMTYTAASLNPVLYKHGEFTDAEQCLHTRTRLDGDSVAWCTREAICWESLATLHNLLCHQAIRQRQQITAQILLALTGLDTIITNAPRSPQSVEAGGNASSFKFIDTNITLQDLDIGIITPTVANMSTFRDENTDAASYKQLDYLSVESITNLPLWCITMASRDLPDVRSGLLDDQRRMNVSDTALIRAEQFIKRISTSINQPFLATEKLDRPEEEFWDMFEFINNWPSDTLPFVLDSRLNKWLKDAEEFTRLVNDIARFISYYVWVRTPATPCKAWTIMSWGSDTATVIQHGSDDEVFAAHSSILSVALKAREHQLTIIALVIRLTICLAKVSNPVNLIRILPETLQLIRRIYRE